MNSPCRLAAVVVVVAGLFASTAACSPGRLGAARTNANLVSAIASLRVIAVAQFTYQTSCGGFYAPSLQTLGTPSADTNQPFISPDLASDPSVKSGYTISLTPGAPVTEAPKTCTGLAGGMAVREYFVAAVPAERGAPYLALMPDGTIYRSPEPIRTTFGAPPPSPAVPVQ